MRIFEKKILCEYFEAIILGTKTFEFREDEDLPVDLQDAYDPTEQ